MRGPPNILIERYRLDGPRNSNSGRFVISTMTGDVRLMISDGGGWDHVSVSYEIQSRIPTWETMCWVKDLCFRPDELVVQFHVPVEKHINIRKNCLHLWRPQTAEEIQVVRQQWGKDWPLDMWPADLPSPGTIPLPPKEMV